MELGLQTFAELEEILQNKVKVGSAQVDELVGLIESKVTERLEYLDKDIVRKQRKRFQALEDKVQ
jgi:predicted transcriptional regulator